LVGAAQALALAKNNISCVLVDKARTQDVLKATHDGRVSAISQASVKVLHHIGVWEELSFHANPIERIMVTEGARSAKVVFDANEVGEPFGFMLPNIYLRQALLRAVLDNATMIDFREVCGVKDVVITPSVQAVLEDETLLRAELLVIADGRYSTLRDKVGIHARKFEYGQEAIVCTIWHEKPHLNTATEWFFPVGPLAVLPMQGGHHSCVVWTEKEGMAAYIAGLPKATFCEELALKLQGVMGNISLESEVFRYPLNLFQASRYTAQNTVVIGDAAHAIHPIAGQGVNLGYRDVAALTEILVEAKRHGHTLGNATYLQRYQQWRSFDAASMIAVTDGLNRLFSTEKRSVKALRQLGMAAFERIKPAKMLFMEAAMGVSGDLPKMLQSKPI
jgi:2-octaprenyl-6-methoxyphenol hydroxylase